MSWDKRQNPRYECRGAAKVQIVAGEPPVPAKIVDLSVEGCLLILRKRQSLPKDMRVELIFEVDHLPFRVRGQVREARSDKMVGFQFFQVNERVRRNLKDLVEELKGNIVKRLAEIKAHQERLKAHEQVALEDTVDWRARLQGGATRWSDGTGRHPGKPHSG